MFTEAANANAECVITRTPTTTLRIRFRDIATLERNEAGSVGTYAIVTLLDGRKLWLFGGEVEKLEAEGKAWGHDHFGLRLDGSIKVFAFADVIETVDPICPDNPSLGFTFVAGGRVIRVTDRDQMHRLSGLLLEWANRNWVVRFHDDASGGIAVVALKDIADVYRLDDGLLAIATQEHGIYRPSSQDDETVTAKLHGFGVAFKDQMDFNKDTVDNYNRLVAYADDLADDIGDLTDEIGAIESILEFESAEK